ncbi:flavin reductase family protein [Streptomyces iconiensis]|uniref:Flavin reductase family protein n=1 Tax=Streptomyces iconiensis TaxID=1384038 RepID=A0ABT6ZZ11_9ACTN|nr:flavin reductase family protein [Streptomyces iconiensis]MDJ1133663.1 flavin reductase family protein [Streptomyces iconiensis]
MVPEIQQPDIRPLMAGFPTGVAVITTLAPGGEPWGMTCTSLCSVALDPPTLLVCLRQGSPTLDAVRESGSFSVNLLHSQARSTAELFASGAKDRFEKVAWRTEGPVGGPHLYEAAHTVADCAVEDVQPVGDHCVVMGRAVDVAQLQLQLPLLYGMRRYGSWTDAAEDSHLYYDFMS